MGQLIYDGALVIQVDDWGLQHLQAVMITKLRRDESFSFSWDDGDAGVGGDTARSDEGLPGTIWVSRSSSLYFRFDAKRTAALNRRWLVDLSTAANGSGGLRLLPEPAAPR
jgi:hypothetical protein